VSFSPSIAHNLPWIATIKILFYLRVKKMVVLVVGIILSFSITHWLLINYLGVFEYFFNFLHGKIMPLPSKSTNLRDVDQGFFRLLTYLKTTKVLICSKCKRKKKSCGQRVFWFLPSHDTIKICICSRRR
jgi:hypothetical protein